MAETSCTWFEWVRCVGLKINIFLKKLTEDENKILRKTENMNNNSFGEAEKGNIGENEGIS